MWLEPRVATKSEPVTRQVRKFHPFPHAAPSAWNLLPLPIGRTVWGGEPDGLGSNPSSTTCFSSETVQMTCGSDVHLSNGAAGGPYLTQGSEDSESVRARCLEQFWHPGHVLSGRSRLSFGSHLSPPVGCLSWSQRPLYFLIIASATLCNDHSTGTPTR